MLESTTSVVPKVWRPWGGGGGCMPDVSMGYAVGFYYSTYGQETTGRVTHRLFLKLVDLDNGMRQKNLRNTTS